jgi:hypothetical protein
MFPSLVVGINVPKSFHFELEIFEFLEVMWLRIYKLEIFDIGLGGITRYWQTAFGLWLSFPRKKFRDYQGFKSGSL